MQIQNEEQRLAVLTALKKFTQSRWRKILIEYLESNIKTIENQLFEVNPENNQLKFCANDLKKFERINILWLINLPQTLINEIDGFVMQKDFDEED